MRSCLVLLLLIAAAPFEAHALSCQIITGASSKMMRLPEATFESINPSQLTSELAAQLAVKGYSNDGKFQIERGPTKGCLLPLEALEFRMSQKEESVSGRTELALIRIQVPKKLCDSGLKAFAEPEGIEEVLKSALVRWRTDGSIIETPFGQSLAEYKRIPSTNPREYPEDAVKRISINQQERKAAIERAVGQLPDCKSVG